MKNVIFTLAILFGGIYANAQSVTVTNNSNCPVTFQVYARDANTTPVNFYLKYVTTPITVPAHAASAVYNISSFSWVGGAAPATAGLACNAFLIDYASTTTCRTPKGYLVGNATTGYTATQTMGACACSNTAVQATWGQTSPTTWTLQVN